MKKNLKRAMLYFALPVFIGFIFFIFIEYGMEKTGTVEFCASCHSMKAVHQSYLGDVHSGNNKMGLVATCVDCHLPQDGIVHKLWEKSKMGIKDFAVEYLGDPKKVKWNLKWIYRDKFTFDSGCLKCHGNLEPVDAANPDAAHAHKFYYQEKKHSCMLCHRYTGHKKSVK